MGGQIKIQPAGQFRTGQSQFEIVDLNIVGRWITDFTGDGIRPLARQRGENVWLGDNLMEVGYLIALQGKIKNEAAPVHDVLNRAGQVQLGRCRGSCLQVDLFDFNLLGKAGQRDVQLDGPDLAQALGPPLPGKFRQKNAGQVHFRRCQFGS